MCPLGGNGWEVIKCTTMDEAIDAAPDVVIVWAFDDLYVFEYEDWEDAPPAIWHLVALDSYPEGVELTFPSTLPGAMFDRARRMVWSQR
jgi:hypothetical protein